MPESATSPTSVGDSAHPYCVVAMFHPSVHVLDLDDTERWFSRVFGVSSVPLSPVPVDLDNRMDYSRFAFIRDVVIDYIDPTRFVKQGKQQYPTIEEPRPMGFGWYVDGVAELYRALRKSDIQIAGLIGVTDVDGTDNEPPKTLGTEFAMFFTVPDDIGLRYQFIAPGPMHFDPRMQEGWELEAPGDDDPLGIAFTSHHTILTDRPDRVSKLFEVLGGEVLHTDRNEVIGASSTYIRLADGAYEIAVPDPGTTAREVLKLDAPKDRYYAITFKVGDLDKTRRHLAANGVDLRTDTPDVIVTDPKTSTGIPWGFTTKALPGDDRV